MNAEVLDENNYQEKIKNSANKLVLKKRRKVLIISLILILVTMCALFLIHKYIQSKNRISFDKYELYQYFSGIRYDYNGKVTIEKGKKITSIKSEKLNINAEQIPIYFQKIDNEMIFPSQMELIFPNIKNKNYRINYFSKIKFEIDQTNENVFLDYNGKEQFLNKCFFYDGEDLYFFPYSTTVNIEDISYELSPLSYIIVNYRGEIEMYDKAKDKYTIIEEHTKDVIASLDNYNINLSTDIIMYDNNDNRLLYKNIDKLKLYDSK